MPDSAFGFDPELGGTPGSTGGGVGTLAPSDATAGAKALQGSLLAQEQEYKSKVDPLLADAQKEFAASQEAEAPYRKKILAALESPNAAHAHLEKVADEPKPEDYQKFTKEYASGMALLGAFAGRWTRNAGNASLNAFAGALNGWKQGNLQAYQTAAKEWEQATKKTLENNQIELEKYKEIMADKKANIDQMMAAMNIVSSEHQNKAMFEFTLAKNYTASFSQVDKLEAIQARVQTAMDKGIWLRQKQEDDFRDKIEVLNNDPEKWNKVPEKDRLNLEATAKHLGVEVKQPPPGGKPPGWTDEQWNISADYYRLTGKQPTLGWGAEMNQYKLAMTARANERAAANVPIDPAAEHMAGEQAGYAGQVSGARSLGTRGTNIELAANLSTVAIPQALEASDAFPRGQWRPVNAGVLKAYEAGSSVPLSKWDIANLQIAEMYARSLNPNAYTIRKDMFDRAVDSISQAKSPEAYKATLQSIYEAMNRERQAIQATQKQIRGEPAELPDPFAAKGGSGPGGTTSSGVQWSVQP